MKFLVLVAFLFSLSFAQTKKLDSFESLDGWEIFISEATEINKQLVDGVVGKALRFDYDFTKGTGFGGVQKAFQIELPENFEFTFYLKADSPPNNFEFKLIDESGDNVWWVNNTNFDFPTEWKKITIKKRDISFAWGPSRGQPLTGVHTLEFTIASFVGGKGSIYLDELALTQIPLPNLNPPMPEIVTSSNQKNATKMLDNNLETIWISDELKEHTVTLDFKGSREFGGLIIRWGEEFPSTFRIETSYDNSTWQKVFEVENFNGGNSFIRLHEHESSFLRLAIPADKKRKFSIKEIEIKPIEFSSTLNQFLINVAKEHKRGLFPRYFNDEKSYWNIMGVNNDMSEGLINEEGMVEVDKLQFSIEPFLYNNIEFITWNDVKLNQSLKKDYLPISTVHWNHKDIELDITSFAHGEENKSSMLFIEYRLKNKSNENQAGNLFLAIRPFQVNPAYQFLNITGGAADVNKIRREGEKIYVNENKIVIPFQKFDGFGVTKFSEADIVEFISENKLPKNQEIKCNLNLASAALKFAYNLKPNEEKKFVVAVPFHGYETGKFSLGSEEENKKYFQHALTETTNFWDSIVTQIKWNLPESADKIINTIRSNIAYILINRDKAGIQPGSRAYERSWIRDGSLTSSALLKMGIVDEVEEFATWYAGYQYESGKVPCVVDRRGPDPVPEHDSHGQLIYLIKQYYNFTHDTTFLRSKYQNVRMAVKYMESIIAEKTNAHFRDGNDSVRAYYGILTESISHEGYSEKPMHSYWDNFFAIRGFKDAVDIATILNEKEDVKWFTRVRDTFEKNLYNSIDLAMQTRGIDFIPGCVELGDFDPTSTTIAIYPVNEFHNLPKPQVYTTFDRYFEFFNDRKNSKINWRNYTPYEVRIIGSYIFMGQIERAHALIDYFMNDQRPQGWNHWAEVVWSDYRLARFIGDMPHTWVGSDFINAIRTFFIYENEADTSLILGAGLFREWIDYEKGMSIENLPTYWGDISYSIQKKEDRYLVKIYGADFNKKNIIINFRNLVENKKPSKVLLNGNEYFSFDEKFIFVNEFPVNLEIIK